MISGQKNCRKYSSGSSSTLFYFVSFIYSIALVVLFALLNDKFKKNKAVAIFSLEMSKEQLVNRLFSLESQVDAQSLRTGNMKDSDWEKLIEGAGIIGQSKLIIDDTPGISIAELRSKCRKYKMENNLGLIIIDYLQLMRTRRIIRIWN